MRRRPKRINEPDHSRLEAWLALVRWPLPLPLWPPSTPPRRCGGGPGCYAGTGYQWPISRMEWYSVLRTSTPYLVRHACDYHIGWLRSKRAFAWAASAWVSGQRVCRWRATAGYPG